MLVFNNTNIQVAPCIASKVRFALQLKVVRPVNIKRCTLEYWTRVIETISIIHNINPNVQQAGLDSFNDLIN